MRTCIFFYALFMCQISSAAPTWILLGDSNMSNVARSTYDGALGTAAQLTPSLLTAERNIVVKNLSSPGHSLAHTDHTGFGNVTPTLASLGGLYSAYDGIIIQAGTNDFTRSAQWGDTVASLRKIMTHARALQKKVLVMEPIWRRDEDKPNAVGNTLNTYRYFAYIVCTQEYADICHFAHRNNSGLNDATASQYYDANEQAAGVELHLNTAGHRKFANWTKTAAAAAGLF